MYRELSLKVLLSRRSFNEFLFLNEFLKYFPSKFQEFPFSFTRKLLPEKFQLLTSSPLHWWVIGNLLLSTVFLRTKSRFISMEFFILFYSPPRCVIVPVARFNWTIFMVARVCLTLDAAWNFINAWLNRTKINRRAFTDIIQDARCSSAARQFSMFASINTIH